MRFLILLFFGSFCFGQVSMELTPQGFAPVVFPRPDAPDNKIVERAVEWVTDYHRREYDIYDIMPNGLKIDALRKNAFYYRSRGETYFYNIRYTLEFSCGEKQCEVRFSVKDMYVRQTLSEKQLRDFFAPDGKLKSEFIDVKPSLERTAGTIVNSFVNFMK